MNALKTLFAFFVCLVLTASAATQNTPTDPAVKTEIVLLHIPIPQEEVTNGHLSAGETVPKLSSTGMVTSVWQPKHQNSQIVGLRPIIKENAIYGWEVDWKPTKNQEVVLMGYVPNTNAFILPDGMSTEDALKEMWKKTSQKLDLENASPIAINAKTTDGKTVVYGIWYKYRDSGAYVDSRDGKLHIRRQISSLSMNPMGDYAAAVDRPFEVQAQLPKAVLDRPELILGYHGPVEGETVVMKPFVVTGMKDWMGLGIVADRSNGKTIKVVVENVEPERPYALAGFKKGQILTSINGIEVAGLTKAEVEKAMNAFIEKRTDFRAMVMDSSKGTPHEITIKLEEFVRRAKQIAANKDNTVAAVGPP